MTRAETPQLITLLTDFGLDDGYVAAMKGVILARAPEARIVDICHTIPPQDILHGGLVWASAVPYFGPDTIHVAVVDPGVGSGRRILAFEARSGIFLAPDNGLIGCVLSRRQIRRVVEVKRREFCLAEISDTFHGRDIFAPAAAALARGAALERLGPPVRRHERLDPPRPRRSRPAGARGEFVERGEVLLVDHFGNAITNLRRRKGATLLELELATARLARLARTYSEVRPGKLLALVGSTGRIEVAVRNGSAAALLEIGRGTTVRARWREA